MSSPVSRVPPKPRWPECSTISSHFQVYRPAGKYSGDFGLCRADVHAWQIGTGERIGVPLGVAHFPRELPMPPRSWVERVFDVRRWTEMPAGGHFAALEQSQLLAEEVRAFFRPVRQLAPLPPS
jgi:pimeloyl-ACP methyl ester carboxylesterase